MVSYDSARQKVPRSHGVHKQNLARIPPMRDSKHAEVDLIPNDSPVTGGEVTASATYRTARTGRPDWGSTGDGRRDHTAAFELRKARKCSSCQIARTGSRHREAGRFVQRCTRSRSECVRGMPRSLVITGHDKAGSSTSAASRATISSRRIWRIDAPPERWSHEVSVCTLS